MPPWMLKIGNWFEGGGWVGAAVLLLGVGALYAGISSARAQWNFLSSAKSATAEITNVQKIVERVPNQPANSRQKRQRWVFDGQFTLPDQTVASFSITELGAMPSNLKVGDKVAVAYIAENPGSTTQFVTMTRGLAMPAGIALVGVVLLGVGAAISLR